MSLRLRCSQLLFSLPESSEFNSTITYDPASSNTLRSSLISGEFSYSDYDSKIFLTSIPWLAVAFTALVVYIIFIINGIFLRRWSSYAKGFWSCCKRPQSEKYKKLHMKAGLFFGICVLSVSILGLIFARNNRSKGDEAACSLIELADRITNGTSSMNWKGISKSTFSYSWARDIFAQEAPVVDVYFETDVTNVTLKIDEYKADMDTLFQTRSNYYVISADIADPVSTTIEPAFFTTMGPKETDETYLNRLVKESDVLSETITASSQGLNTTISDFLTQRTTIQDELNLAADSYKEFGEVLNVFTQAVASYVEDNYDSWVLKDNVTMASFIILIVVSSTLYFTVMMHHKGKFQIVSQFSYISWHIMMIWVIVAAYLASEIQMLKKRASEHCDVFNTLVTDNTFVNALGPSLSQNFSQVLETCFFAEGDTFRAVGFENGGDLIDELAKYVWAVNPYIVNGPGSSEIKAQKDIIDEYIYGIRLATTDETDTRSTAYNLNAMNSWANYEEEDSNQAVLSQCEITLDKWVMNETTCEENQWGSAYRPGDFLGENICFGIWSFDSVTIKNRYKDANFVGCQAVSGETISQILTKQYDGLNRHFTNVKNKFTHLKRFYENNLNGKYKDILKEASTLTRPMEYLNNTMRIVLDYVAGPQNGVLYNSNCSFLKGDLINTSKHVCDLSSSLKKTLMTLAGVSVLGVLSSIFIYLYFRKLERPWKLINGDKHYEINQIMPEPFSPEIHRMDTGPVDDLDNEPVIQGERIEI